MDFIAIRAIGHVTPVLPVQLITKVLACQAPVDVGTNMILGQKTLSRLDRRQNGHHANPRKSAAHFDWPSGLGTIFEANVEKAKRSGGTGLVVLVNLVLVISIFRRRVRLRPNDRERGPV